MAGPGTVILIAAGEKPYAERVLLANAERLQGVTLEADRGASSPIVIRDSLLDSPPMIFAGLERSQSDSAVGQDRSARFLGGVAIPIGMRLRTGKGYSWRVQQDRL
jgi:hypothetical protein